MAKVQRFKIKINKWVTQIIMLLKGNQMFTSQQIGKTITIQYLLWINRIKIIFKTIRLEQTILRITLIEVKIFKDKIKIFKMNAFKTFKINKTIILFTKVNLTAAITNLE